MMKPRNTPESEFPLEDCNSPRAYLRLFQSLGIPNKKWRSSYWLYSLAKAPKDKGGIGVDLRVLVEKITVKFGSFTSFLDWMDGVPLDGISSDKEAHALLEAECERLGTSMQEILGGEKTVHFMDKSAVLREVLTYFDSKE